MSRCYDKNLIGGFRTTFPVYFLDQVCSHDLFLERKLIGGNVLMSPPLKILNIVGAQIDWRKCFEKSSDQKFEYVL